MPSRRVRPTSTLHTLSWSAWGVRLDARHLTHDDLAEAGAAGSIPATSSPPMVSRSASSSTPARGATHSRNHCSLMIISGSLNVCSDDRLRVCPGAQANWRSSARSLSKNRRRSSTP